MKNIEMIDVINSKVELVNGIGESSGVFIGLLGDTYRQDSGYEIKEFKGDFLNAIQKFNGFNSDLDEKLYFSKCQLPDGKIANFVDKNEILFVQLENEIYFYSLAEIL